MSVNRFSLKIELTERKLETFDRISSKSADRCVENNGGRRSEPALVLPKWRYLILCNWSYNFSQNYVFWCIALIYSSVKYVTFKCKLRIEDNIYKYSVCWNRNLPSYSSHSWIIWLLGQNIFLIFVVPCIMLNSEINPTRCNNCVYSSQWLYFFSRCNNCVYSSQWLYSTCFGWQFHPSSGVHMLYMASGRQVYCKLTK